MDPFSIIAGIAFFSGIVWLVTRPLFWVITLFFSGLATLFSMIACIISFAILPAIGLFCLLCILYEFFGRSLLWLDDKEIQIIADKRNYELLKIKNEKHLYINQLRVSGLSDLDILNQLKTENCFNLAILHGVHYSVISIGLGLNIPYDDLENIISPFSPY